MTDAPAVPTIQQALAAVMADVRGVGKDDVNSQQGYKFRGIDAVVNAVGPSLRKNNVVVLPAIQSYEYNEVLVGKNRTPMGHARLIVKYTFVGPAGDTLEAITPGEANDSGDKATPKAMSVAFRTALLQALALPTDEPDPDAHTYQRSAQQQEHIDLINEIARLAGDTDGRQKVLERWAVEHDGQHIGQATSLPDLLALRDELAQAVAVNDEPA